MFFFFGLSSLGWQENFFGLEMNPRSISHIEKYRIKTRITDFSVQQLTRGNQAFSSRISILFPADEHSDAPLHNVEFGLLFLALAGEFRAPLRRASRKR